MFFLNFAESTLDHELRIHVKELADRNMAIDEINREIDRLFKENGIEIAFRQLDVNLRTSKGLEKLVQSYRIDEKGSANVAAEPARPQPHRTRSPPVTRATAPLARTICHRAERREPALAGQSRRPAQ
ncbi:hypothetical protein ULG90_22985 [Halopseudomonas pachastrellae]|nr:hypothetical protein ULG90_22985 [Halopseudomonas pachastrellae]